MGVGLSSRPIAEFLAATADLRPYEIDAALLASGAYFDEYTTVGRQKADSARGLAESRQRGSEVFGKAQERVITALMGE